MTIGLLRRWAGLLCALLALLTGCAAPFSQADIPTPPAAVAYADEQDGQIDALLAELDRNVAVLFAESDFAISEQQTYTSTLTLDGVIQFYTEALPSQGWDEVTRVPSNGGQAALLAYRRRDQLFVVAALDLRDSAGAGVLVYTIQAQR